MDTHKSIKTSSGVGEPESMLERAKTAANGWAPIAVPNPGTPRTMRPGTRVRMHRSIANANMQSQVTGVVIGAARFGDGKRAGKDWHVVMVGASCLRGVYHITRGEWCEILKDEK